MSETVPMRRRHFWLAALVTVGAVATLTLWGVANSGPEICGWGGPTLCFRPARVELAGIATAAIVAVIALLVLVSVLTARRPAVFRWVCGAGILATAVGTAACVGAMI